MQAGVQAAVSRLRIWLRGQLAGSHDAAAHLGLDRYDKAAGHTQQTLALYRRTGYRLGQARALVELGHALEHTDGIDAAQPCWHEALMLFTEIGSPEADRVHALLSAASRTAAGDSELESS